LDNTLFLVVKLRILFSAVACYYKGDGKGLPDIIKTMLSESLLYCHIELVEM